VPPVTAWACSAAAGEKGPAIVIVPFSSASEPTHSKVPATGLGPGTVSVQTWLSLPAAVPSSNSRPSVTMTWSPADGPGLPRSRKAGSGVALASTRRMVRSWPCGFACGPGVPA
jgi:hypothetical protein